MRTLPFLSYDRPRSVHRSVLSGLFQLTGSVLATALLVSTVPAHSAPAGPPAGSTSSSSSSRVTAPAWAGSTLPASAGSYLVLCYHSIPARYNGDANAISAPNLAEQLAWLSAAGYSAISMDDVETARVGGKPLPARSFMLTVDDGYEDFYINAFPLLKLHHIPAVFGLVGRWIEEREPVDQKTSTDRFFAKQKFVSWDQVNEMVASGLVEIASHSYDLHHGILANPQQNTEPAAVTLAYDAASNTYETTEQRRLRVRADLQKNSALIKQHTGRAARIMVWPYGATDAIAAEEAARAGMPINFTLSDGLASARDERAVPRTLVGEELTLSTFSYMVQFGHTVNGADPLRAIRVNLDRIYDPDPAQQNTKLGKLIEQISRLGINAVLIQPYVTPAPGGLIEQVYFPNAVLPMRADLLNRVAWQLRSRLRVEVFILIDAANIGRTDQGALRRLDFTQPLDRDQLLGLYSDLGAHTASQGLVFDGARADAAQRGFNAQLVQRLNYFPPPALNNIAAGALDADWNTYGPLNGRYHLHTVAAPKDPTAATIERFARQLSADHLDIVALPVKDAALTQLASTAEAVRLLQRRGVFNFLLDGDNFLDDPQKLETIRKAISLKDNPLLAREK